MSAPADPFELAHGYGIDIALSDLGAAAERVRIAEYEPEGPTIRINTRALERAADPIALARRAVAHELYHHRERLGEVERFPDRSDRERAADDFACELLALQ